MSVPPARVVALGLACVLLALPLYEDLASVLSAASGASGGSGNTARAVRVSLPASFGVEHGRHQSDRRPTDAEPSQPAAAAGAEAAAGATTPAEPQDPTPPPPPPGPADKPAAVTDKRDPTTPVPSTQGVGATAAARRPSNGGSDGAAALPVFQMCPAAKAPADRWVVERGVWGDVVNVSLHLLEAEVLRPPASSPSSPPSAGAGGERQPDVVSLLAVIADDSNADTHHVRLPHWNPMVMTKPQGWYDKLVDALWCEWPGDGGAVVKTKARAVWFREKGHLLGLLLQCAVPRAEIAFDASGFPVTLATQNGKSSGVRMCPNRHATRRYRVVLCTTHQFPNPKIGRRDLVEWLEYHRLLGVDHVFFRDRVRVPYGRDRRTERGFHNDSLKPYVEEGFVTYIPGPYHPPLDWGSVYSDQLYTNAACYMRLRHATEWIGTVDLDEMIEVQHAPTAPGGSATPWHLPEYLDSLPGTVQEVALMHCRLMTIGKGGKWEPHGRSPANNRRLVLPSGDAMRNCREDIPAGKSIGRTSAIGFSHVHYLHPAVGHADPGHAGTCAWRWDGAANGTTPPASCLHNADYPARLMNVDHFKSYGVYDPWVGVNHGGGKWLTFRGTRGNATSAFVNATLNAALEARLARLLGDGGGGAGRK